MTVTEHQRVTLSCQVSANPKPTFKWLKRTTEQIQVLINSSRILVSTNQGGNKFSHQSTVVIRSTLSIDSGEYICAAENRVTMSALPVISPTIIVTVNGELTCTAWCRNQGCWWGGGGVGGICPPVQNTGRGQSPGPSSM